MPIDGNNEQDINNSNQINNDQQNMVQNNSHVIRINLQRNEISNDNNIDIENQYIIIINLSIQKRNKNKHYFNYYFKIIKYI